MKRLTLFTFYEMPIFWKNLDKLASGDVLEAIQKDLLSNPERGVIISGTNGVRKARVADPKTKRGKSGSFRYIYLLLQNEGVIYLIYFFAKSEMDNIDQADKKEISELVKALKSKYARKG